MISRIPADGGDIFLSLFFIGKSPNWQLMTFVFHGIKSFSVWPVILIVIILFFLVILHYHTFHNFQLFFKAGRVQSWSLDFVDLLILFSLRLLSLELFHASIENFPLIHLKRELDGDRGLSRDTFSSNGVIHSLTLSVIVVEFISQSFFNHGDIIDHTSRIFSFLLSFGLVDHILFNIIDFILDSSFITIFQNKVSGEVKMDL